MDALPRISRKLAQQMLTALHTLELPAETPELTLEEAAKLDEQQMPAK